MIPTSDLASSSSSLSSSYSSSITHSATYRTIKILNDLLQLNNLSNSNNNNNSNSNSKTNSNNNNNSNNSNSITKEEQLQQLQHHYFYRQSSFIALCNILARITPNQLQISQMSTLFHAVCRNLIDYVKYDVGVLCHVPKHIQRSSPLKEKMIELGLLKVTIIQLHRAKDNDLQRTILGLIYQLLSSSNSNSNNSTNNSSRSNLSDSSNNERKKDAPPLLTTKQILEKSGKKQVLMKDLAVLIESEWDSVKENAIRAKILIEQSQ